ncbi:hypothetical protein [Mesorhizobium sp. M8A.F.Ca.ET.021.01.1.1]|uniref:hypothetical protein n=1 Tax=Mesorhizobium sp. M8A.F.Ca.ET.021.01.1.1 TaxID=2496757 RepID=UPI000FCB73A8|nr:hypothetical protein [Mesorhizobium sp. M8A.F.Ca.ET.021.01.1.1]RUW56818.1 hypothetical protein EOA36_02135 [Mesorhizobium sp. M8A.F.Ca.ET.021.01.1.1]
MDTASNAADLRQDLDADISVVLEWVRRSLETFKPLNSPHEGYAHIKAHLDKLWGTVLADSYRPIDRKLHAYNMSAAAVRYIIDLTPFKPSRTEADKIVLAIDAVHAEVKKAMIKHKPMVSVHEGYGVILEEVDELFEEVRPDRGRTTEAQKEALQVAAMGVRFVLDVAEKQR